MCQRKHNIFSRVRMPKRRLSIQASTYGVGIEETLEDKGKEVGNERINGSMRSKILSHFVKGIFF